MVIFLTFRFDPILVSQAVVIESEEVEEGSNVWSSSFSSKEGFSTDWIADVDMICTISANFYYAK